MADPVDVAVARYLETGGGRRELMNAVHERGEAVFAAMLGRIRHGEEPTIEADNSLKDT